MSDGSTGTGNRNSIPEPRWEQNRLRRPVSRGATPYSSVHFVYSCGCSNPAAASGGAYPLTMHVPIRANILHKSMCEIGTGKLPDRRGRCTGEYSFPTRCTAHGSGLGFRLDGNAYRTAIPLRAVAKAFFTIGEPSNQYNGFI